MSTTEVEMFRGDNHEINIVVKDQYGVLVNITGARIRFTAVTLPTSLTKDSDVGDVEVEITDGPNGEAQIKIVPADTTSLEVASYRFDIEMTLSSKVYTLSSGFFRLKQDLTS